MTMADRIAILDKGEVMQVATPAEVYEAPGSRFVAGFVGNVNMFEGTVASCDGGGAKIAGKDGLTIDAENPGGAAPGTAVAFAIRPEKMRISRDAPTDPSVNALAGEVWDIGYLGDVSIYHVRLASGAIVRCTQANRARLIERPITWQDRVFLTWGADASVILKS